MKINYTGIIAEEQCMKAGSWQADEPVAHINVVKSLIAQVNEAMAENAKLCRELAEAREIIIKQKLQLTELEQQIRNLWEMSVDDTKQKGVIGRENNQLHELLQQCLDVIMVTDILPGCHGDITPLIAPRLTAKRRQAIKSPSPNENDS